MDELLCSWLAKYVYRRNTVSAPTVIVTDTNAPAFAQWLDALCGAWAVQRLAEQTQTVRQIPPQWWNPGRQQNRPALLVLVGETYHVPPHALALSADALPPPAVMTDKLLPALFPDSPLVIATLQLRGETIPAAFIHWIRLSHRPPLCLVGRHAASLQCLFHDDVVRFHTLVAPSNAPRAGLVNMAFSKDAATAKLHEQSPTIGSCCVCRLCPVRRLCASRRLPRTPAAQRLFAWYSHRVDVPGRRRRTRGSSHQRPGLHMDIQVFRITPSDFVTRDEDQVVVTDAAPSYSDALRKTLEFIKQPVHREDSVAAQ